MASQIAAVPASRDIVIATLPQGAAEVTINEGTRLELIHNRYPGAPYQLRHDGSVRFVREAAASVAERADCAAARRPLAPGDYLAPGDLARVRCQQQVGSGWLRYDAGARSYFARQAIPAGSYLGRVSTNQAIVTSEGATLFYRTSEGPVVIEREVVALQPGHAGNAVFVRTEEGKVLSAPLAGEEVP
jgi:flagella basal body P-ring formation protein FlgA